MKQSQIEVGQWKSYAQELEDKVKKLEDKLSEKEEQYELSIEEKKMVAEKLREKELWKNLHNENKALIAKNRKLEHDKKEIIQNLIKANQRIKELEDNGNKEQ